MSNAGELFARMPLGIEPRVLTLADVYAEHTDFIWKTLHRLGVREPHIEDVFQEVFLVVFRRLDSFDGSSAVTTWLFGICFRVATGYRRRAHFRRERIVADVGAATEPAAPDRTPEEELERREAEARLHDILDRLALEQRAVFVMFELDGLSCHEIADMIDCPLGTVHSRLHAARKAFTRALECQERRDARKVG